MRRILLLSLMGSDRSSVEQLTPKKRREVRAWRLAAWSLSLFSLNSLLIVAIHSMRVGEVEFDHTISAHVGFEVYSAMLFALVNTIAIVLLTQLVAYLHKTHRLPKVWFALIAVMGVGFLIASYFPYVGEGQVSSIIHRVGAWGMFGATAVFAVVTFFKIRSRGLRNIGLAFVTYAALSLIGVVMFHNVVWDYVLVVESMFILLSFLFILAIPLRAIEAEPADGSPE